MGKLKIGIIENILISKDNTTRSIRIRTEENVIEKSIKLLYPTELHCDSNSTNSNAQDDKTLNVNAEKTTRSAASALEWRIRDYIK